MVADDPVSRLVRNFFSNPLQFDWDAFHRHSTDEREMFVQAISAAELQRYNMGRQYYLETRQNVQSEEKRQELERLWHGIEIAHQSVTAGLRLLRRNAFVPLVFA